MSYQHCCKNRSRQSPRHPIGATCHLDRFALRLLLGNRHLVNFAILLTCLQLFILLISFSVFLLLLQRFLRWIEDYEAEEDLKNQSSLRYVILEMSGKSVSNHELVGNKDENKSAYLGNWFPI